MPNIKNLYPNFESLLKAILAGKDTGLDATITTAYKKAFAQAIADGYNVELSIDLLKKNKRLANMYTNAVEFAAVKQQRFIDDIKLAKDAMSQADLAIFFDSYFFTQNDVWFQAEMQMITANAQMAERWEQMEQLTTVPNLKYITAGDANVRPEHVSLDGIIRPLADPFWDTYYPPNGYGCRCDVAQVEDEPTALPDKLSEKAGVPTSFRFNAGKTGQIVSNAHPYFNGMDMEAIEAHCRAADKNYNTLK